MNLQYHTYVEDGVLKDVEDGVGKDVELKIVWSKLLYVGEDEDDIVKALFVEDVDDKDGIVIFVILFLFEDAQDHTFKVVLVQEAEDGEVYMASVEDGEDDEDCMVKVVVAEDIEDGARNKSCFS